MSIACCSQTAKPSVMTEQVRRLLWIALLVNATMFAIEVAAGSAAGSVALWADAVDFLGDAGNYGLSLAALALGARRRAQAAMIKGATMAMFGAVVLATAAWRSFNGAPPEPWTMGVVGVLALAANVSVAIMLYQLRDGEANLRAAWLCSRNDSLGNIAVVFAAAGVFGTGSAWPDLIVAAVIGGLALSASVAVLRQALSELRQAVLATEPL